MRLFLLLALTLALAGCTQVQSSARHAAGTLVSYDVHGNETIDISFNVPGFTQQARSSLTFVGQVDAAANATAVAITEGSTRQFNGSADLYNPHALLAGLINESANVINETPDAYALSLPPDFKTAHALLHALDAQKDSFSSLFARPETMKYASISVWVDKKTFFITSARISARYETGGKGENGVIEQDTMHLVFSGHRQRKTQ